MHRPNEGHCFLCIARAPGISGLDFDWVALHLIYDKFRMWFCIFHFFHVVIFGFALQVLGVVSTLLRPWTLFLCWCFWTNLLFLFLGCDTWTWSKFCFFLLCMWLALLCISWLSLWSKHRGKLLFFAMVCIVFHSFCFLSGSRQRRYRMLREYNFSSWRWAC